LCSERNNKDNYDNHDKLFCQNKVVQVVPVVVKKKSSRNMSKITKEQYEFALARIEELLPLVSDETPANDRNAIELTMMSDVVIDYEKEHFPISKPSVAELIELSLEEEGMTQKQLAQEIGVSPSRINDYVSGRAEPTLKIARLLCRVLNITPAQMLGC
jgi:HTH-type transcriptional regulator/antitoxin HigA